MVNTNAMRKRCTRFFSVAATALIALFPTLTGPGADTSKRDPKMKPMTAEDAAKFTIKNIFGSWTPSFSK